MFSHLVWLALGAFTVGTEGFVIAGLLPDISAEAGISVAQGGTLVTAFSLSYAVGAPVLATLLGEVDRRRILAGTMVLFAASNLAAALTSSFLALLLARVVMALSAGLYAATAQATAIALAPLERRARAISVVVGGTTVAVALGALLARLTGWRGTFAAIAALSAIAAVAILLKFPARLRGTRIPLRERAVTIMKPGILPILATTLLAMTGAFAVFTYLAPLAVDGTGLPAMVIPGLLLAFGVGAALGNIIGGQAADRYGGRATVISSTVALSAILTIISLAAKFLSPAFAGPALIVLTILWGIAGWMLPAAQASRLVALQPESAAVSLSLNASALYLGIAIGSILGGAVMNVGTPGDLGWTGAVSTLLALIIVLATGQLPALGRSYGLTKGSLD